MYNITGKLEINMISPEIDPAATSNFALKHRCPAIVMNPEFVPAMLVDRSAKSGQYKIIAAIDFPNGKNFALDKLKHIDPMGLEVDGMDILISQHRTEIDIMNELKTLTEFIRGSINPAMSIRVVLKSYSSKWEEIQHCFEAIKKYGPNMVRIDQHLELPKIGLAEHVDCIEKLRQAVSKPLKISANVDLETIETLSKLEKNIKFDVTPKQAHSIINELNKR